MTSDDDMLTTVRGRPTCISSKSPEALRDAEGVPLPSQHCLDHAVTASIQDGDACFWDDRSGCQLYCLVSCQACRLQGQAGWNLHPELRHSEECIIMQDSSIRHICLILQPGQLPAHVFNAIVFS